MHNVHRVILSHFSVGGNFLEAAICFHRVTLEKTATLSAHLVASRNLKKRDRGATLYQLVADKWVALRSKKFRFWCADSITQWPILIWKVTELTFFGQNFKSILEAWNFSMIIYQNSNFIIKVNFFEFLATRAEVMASSWGHFFLWKSYFC